MGETDTVGIMLLRAAREDDGEQAPYGILHARRIHRKSFIKRLAVSGSSHRLSGKFQSGAVS